MMAESQETRLRGLAFKKPNRVSWDYTFLPQLDNCRLIVIIWINTRYDNSRVLTIELSSTGMTFLAKGRKAEACWEVWRRAFTATDAQSGDFTDGKILKGQQGIRASRLPAFTQRSLNLFLSLIANFTSVIDAYLFRTPNRVTSSLTYLSNAWSVGDVILFHCGCSLSNVYWEKNKAIFFALTW